MYRVVIDTTISNVLVPFMDVGFYTSIYFLRFFILRDVDKKIITLPEIRETGVYLAELKLASPRSHSTSKIECLWQLRTDISEARRAEIWVCVKVSNCLVGIY